VGALDPGYIVFFGEFILQIPERIDERRAKGRKTRRQGDIDVLTRRLEYLQSGVFCRLGFRSHRTRVGSRELVNQGRRENVTLAQRQELVVGNIECRPEL
jgi:hypothetical protein